MTQINLIKQSTWTVNFCSFVSCIQKFYEVSFGENYLKNLVLYAFARILVFFKEVNDNFLSQCFSMIS